jgi:hypothetical protein
LDLAIENRSATTFRVPLWLWVDHQPVVVQRGHVLGPYAGGPYVQVADAGSRRRADSSPADQADLPRPTMAGPYRRDLYLHRLEAPANAIDSLPPGAGSPTVPLDLQIFPAVHAFRVTVVLRALPASPLVPPAAPIGVPAGEPGHERWVRLHRAPGPFVRGLVAIRFQPTASSAVRQLLVDRIGGRVIGGRGDPSAGAGERDYLVEVPDTMAGEQTLAAVELLRAWDRQHFLRVGIVPATSPDAVEQPPGRATAASGTAGRSDTIEAEPEGREPPSMEIRLASDASAAEEQATLDLVGATVVGKGWLGGMLVMLADTNDEAYARAGARLWALPVVRGVFVVPRSYGSAEICGGWCGPVPRDSGGAPNDPKVRAFVASLQLPDLHAIRDLVWLPAFDFLVFSATYGSPGDVYPGVLGLRHGGRVGLLHHSDTARAGAWYSYSPRDTILGSRALLDTLERGAPWFYDGSYLDMLIRSPHATSALLARLVPHCFGRTAGWCHVPEMVEAAVRIGDVDALTALSFLRLHQGASTEKSVVPRQGLRRLASMVLADRAASPATLFALALASNDDQPDSALAARLLVHPRVNADLATLTVLVDRRPWIADRVLLRLPARARPTLGPFLRQTFPDHDVADRERLFALLDDPVLGGDRAVLTVMANLRSGPMAAIAEAARRLPDAVFRRWDYYPEPPPLRRGRRCLSCAARRETR